MHLYHSLHQNLRWNHLMTHHLHPQSLTECYLYVHLPCLLHLAVKITFKDISI